MTIKTISCENFRGIESLNKLSCGQINSYVGKNDSGKSSILKALDAFFNKNFSAKDIFQGKTEGSEVSVTIQFVPQMSVNEMALDSEGCITLKKVFSVNDRGRVTIEEQYICNDFNHEISNCWGAKEADLNKFLETLGEDYSKSGRGHTNLSKIEQIENALAGVDKIEKCHSIGEMVKNLNKYYDDFEYPTFSIFDAEVDLNESTTEFQNQFKPIVLTSIDNNQQLTDQIETNVKNDLETEFDIIAGLLRKNIPDLEKINTEVVCNWKTLVKFGLSLKFKDDEFDIPLSHKGTGFKRLLMVAYFEYLAQKGDNKFQYFGIEEPETYLHPQLQHDLLESFKILSQSSQFFITTHSPIFAGATDEAHICVVTKENFRSLYNIPSNRNEMMDMVIKELGIRPSHNLLNENIRKVIFLEGSGDCDFWEIAFDKILGGIPDDILLIPCGGSQVEYYVNSDLCRRLNRNFLVILDKDIGAADYASKQANAAALKARVESDGGEFDLLRKREIENYYHIDAVNRVLNAQGKPNTEMVITAYNDVAREVKIHITPTQANFKKKNNTDVFKEMTKEEWLESAVTEGDSTDLELILARIIQ